MPANRTRIVLAQLNLTVGDLAGNRARIAEASQRAAGLGADLMLTPELAITGYPPEDLLLRPAFIGDVEDELALLETELALPTLVGTPALDGHRLTNAALLLGAGAGTLSYAKRALPNYAVFDEERVFAAGQRSSFLRIGEALAAVSICEDIWFSDGPVSADQAAGAELILNLSASPFQRGKPARREQMLQTRARDGLSFIAYCNLVGGQDELVFDGGSVVIGPDGRILARAARFMEELLVVDLDHTQVLGARLRETRLRRPTVRRVPVPTPDAVIETLVRETTDPEHQLIGVGGPLGSRTFMEELARTQSLDQRRVARRFHPVLEEQIAGPPGDEVREVWRALRLGLESFVAKNGFAKVVLGLSGGIDSALVAALACEALGPERVICVSMPSRFNSGETRSDARTIAESLRCEFRELPIEQLRRAVQALLPETAGVAAENVQARLRGLALMTISNQEGPLVLACSNKSETAVGYATLYGDTAGGFAPIKDVPKTLVFELARLVNRRAGRELIPERVISRPPSAELAEDQRDSDSLPDYPVLDAILDAYVERDLGVREIVAEGIADHATVSRIARLVDGAEHKRRQAPPGTRATAKAFGRDRRLPITSRYREAG